MDSVTRALILGVAAPIPLAVAALWTVWKRTPTFRAAQPLQPAAPTARWRLIATAAAIPAIFFVAWLAGYGLPRVPPASGGDWLLPLAALAGLIGVLNAIWPRVPPGAWMGLRAIVVVGGCILIAKNLFANDWPLTKSLPLVGGAGVLGLLAWWSMDRAGEERGAVAPALVVVAACMMSAVAALNENIMAAITPATLCAVVGPALVVGIFRPALMLGRGLALAAAFITANAFYLGVIGGVSPFQAGLVMAGLVLVGVSGLPGVAPPRDLARVAVRIAMVAIPGLLAVGWALLESRASDSY